MFVQPVLAFSVHDTICYRLGMSQSTNCCNSRSAFIEIRSVRVRSILVALITLASPGLLWTEEEDSVGKSTVKRAVESASTSPETAKVATEDAPTVDPGRTEVELTYSFGHAGRVFNSAGHVRDRGTLDVQLFTVTATRGLVDGLDTALSVAWQDLIVDDDDEFDDGVGNVVVNAKWRFFQSGDGTMVLSWLPGFTAPFSGEARDREFIPLQDYWSLDNLVALTLVGERLNLSLDAGYVLPFGGERNTDRGNITGNAALGYQLTPWFQPEVELNYGHGFVDDGTDTDFLGATAGVILNLPRDLRLDLGFRQTFYGRNVELGTGVLANFSVTF